MIQSMTGFGAAEAVKGGFNLSVEMKAVNHRFLDMKVRVPSDWHELDLQIREFLKKKFKRGYFDVMVKREILPDQVVGAYVAHTKLAKSYFDAASKVTKALKLAPPTVGHVLKNSDFVRFQTKTIPGGSKWKFLKPVLEQAASNFEKMRSAEGKNLEKELLKRLSNLGQIQKIIEKTAPQVKKMLKDRLQKRLDEANLPGGINPDRLEQEVVFLAEKADITEEVVRLQSHIGQFKKIMKANKLSIGKQLDFLIQEMNREINTISSKSNTLDINSKVVDFKSELEKLKEQVQNVE